MARRDASGRARPSWRVALVSWSLVTAASSLACRPESTPAAAQPREPAASAAWPAPLPSASASASAPATTAPVAPTDTPSVASASAPTAVSSAPPTPPPVSCKTENDCWFDDAYKPIARPPKLRGKKIVPCKTGEHSPACVDGACVVRAWKC